MHAMQHIEALGVWIAEDAVVCGDVQLGRDSSVWYHAVIRGDVAPIRLGRRVNVQDHAVLHCRTGTPLEIADNVAIGHRATVHCRSIGQGSLIGIGSTILDDAVIGERCIVAAGAVVPPRMKVPDGSLVMGIPAKLVRSTTDDDLAYIEHSLQSYVDLAAAHAAGHFPRIT